MLTCLVCPSVHIFLDFRKKEPALQNFRPLTGPCIQGSNRQILAKQVLLKTQVLVLAGLYFTIYSVVTKE